MMKNINQLQMWDTQLYADCVEFCPFEPYSSIAICGTYQLRESETLRVGRLSIHSVNVENTDLTPLQLLDTVGILDVKWCREKVNNEILLSAANALGEIILYKLDSDCHISQVSSQRIGDQCLALSCDWWGSDKITVSDSKGCITCLCVTGTETRIIDSWKGHGFEAWVSSFDRHSDQLIYSGGDDSRFCLWDLRSLPNPIYANTKGHQMGITSIETSPTDENVLATGSYDEHLLLWDKRKMKSCVSDVHLGGGVWKLKWEPGSNRHLLAATMHNGFHIVDCYPSNSSKTEPHIITSYMEHSSLAYGCDWKHSHSPVKVIATCSFYDHSLHAWTWNSLTSNLETSHQEGEIIG